MKRRLSALAALLTFSIVCNLIAAAEPNTTAAEPNAPAETAPDIIAVTVNGTDVTEADLEAEIDKLLMRSRVSPQAPPHIMNQYKKQLRQPALENLISKSLLDEKIKQANITVTEEDITNDIKEIISRQGLSLDEFKKRLQNRGLDFDQWKQKVQLQRGLIYDKFFETQFPDKLKVAEDEAKKHYLENEKQLVQVRASHILIKTNINDTNEFKATAKAKAEELLKQLQDGADFAELAKANSDDPGSGPDGGDLGFFRRNRMVPPFESAAFELEINQLSDIVETGFGYHIIKVTDRRDAFEQLTDQVIRTLKRKKQGEFAKEYLESLKKEASIVYPAGKEPQTSSAPTTKQNQPKKEEAEKPENKPATE
jgi:parvulin-like peptidyl-prolyl isomerase